MMGRYWVTVQVPVRHMNEAAYEPIKRAMDAVLTGTLFHDGVYDMDWVGFFDDESAKLKAEAVHALGIEGVRVLVLDKGKPEDPVVVDLETAASQPP